MRWPVLRRGKVMQAWGVGEQAQRLEPAGILGDRDGEVGGGCYETKPGSQARARQVAQAPAHAMRHSATL